ncbi:MAG TPA: T9SS type A sorting domain-containing protein [Segetibacter sp.]|jgi:hypothetical protein
MKHKILPLFTIAALSVSSHLHAQKNSAYAVTGATKGNISWTVIREIDLASGAVIRTVYDPAVNKTVHFKAAGGGEVNKSFQYSSATASGVAATAFDQNHNRLYFTSMRGNDLMYFDLASPGQNVVVVVNNPAFNTGNKLQEGNVITRMAFASDGFGYAITNDGKSIVRFTTDQKPGITNLGELIDGKKNGTMSVHNQCSSWGGDMVGDSYGNLYMVTYRNHIFKINPQTRVADYLGQLKGLPVDFTTNGMVVDNKGDLIISSAANTQNYYQVNISTLDAAAIKKTEDKVYNSSDLANGNLLYERKGASLDNFIAAEIKGNQAVSIYPNPSFNKTFSVQFDKVPLGRYNLVLADAAGRSVLSKALIIGMKGQVEKMTLPRTAGGGMYLVKLTGKGGAAVYTDKLVVQ